MRKFPINNPFLGHIIINKLLNQYYHRKKIYSYLLINAYRKRADKVINYDRVSALCMENLNHISAPDKSLFLQLFEKERESISNIAKRHVENKFNILGSGWIDLVDLNWSKDYKSGYIWEKGKHYKKYECISY